MRTWLLAVSFGVFAAQATPPRDSPARAETGTAVVRGHVRSAATGDPLHRVRLTFNGPNPTPPSTVTNTRGEFEMTGLLAGTYSITATRAGYLTQFYGQQRPHEAGRTVEVRAGEVIEAIDMALARGGVLAGSITDDVGDPYPGVHVEALEFRYLRGRRLLLQTASATTNDLGQFRIGALAPGTYFLRASTQDTWESDDGKLTYAYAITYYPGVTGSDQAQSVNVAVEQPFAGLDFGVRPGRAARITGIMQNAAGEPLASQHVSLGRVHRAAAGALFATQGAGSTRTDRSGSFQFPSLSPGEYIVRSGGDPDAAGVPLVLADGDERHVVLMPRRASAITGSIVTDEGTPANFSSGRIRVVPIAADPESLLPSFTAPSATDVARDWTFRIGNVDGQYLFRVTGLPAEWMLGAVLLRGRNIVDAPVELRPRAGDTSGLQIVLSRKGAKIEGVVVHPDGTPAPDCTVVVFSADAAHWTIASRFVKAVRPDASGRFAVGGLPAGVYAAVAREYVADGQWEDPGFLNALKPFAASVQLGEGEAEQVSLRLEPPR